MTSSDNDITYARLIPRTSPLPIEPIVSPVLPAIRYAEPDDDLWYRWQEEAEEAFGERLGGVVFESDRGVCVYLQEPVEAGDVATLAAILGVPDEPTAWQIEGTGRASDWIVRWREAFQPIDAGRFRVVPPWLLAAESASLAEGRIPIVIDPQMAFGTGQHETTRLCMRVLDTAAEGLRGKSIADIGAGSAILAIAAAKLGCALPVLATEIDPVCVENARQNLEANLLPPSALDYRVTGTIPAEWLGNVDWVLCNMLSERFTPLLPALRKLMRPETGSLILSGYLSTEVAGVETNASALGLACEQRLHEGIWNASIWRAQA